MKHIPFFLFYLFFFSQCNSNDVDDFKDYKITKLEFKLKQVIKNKLNSPWGMTFSDENTLLITEKNGKILKINVVTNEIIEIQHNIPSIKYNGNGQGGLLDIYSHSDDYLYFTYSHEFQEITLKGAKENLSSTAIARGKIEDNKLINFQILLIAKPRLIKNKHYGARIAIKDDFLYVGFGERGEGMISQNPQKHPGSIIRVHTNGDIPKDNPAFKGFEEWLPEIYQIGLRNPQGITLSPFDGEIYFSQHGPMGGDNIGKVKFAGNFGWKFIAWGGTEYTGLKIGRSSFSDTFDTPIISWVPSIGIGNISFYKGEEFLEWEGDLLVTATREKMLARLEIEKGKVINKEIILKNNNGIGRIRDFEIDSNGNIYLISDHVNSSLWVLSKD